MFDFDYCMPLWDDGFKTRNPFTWPSVAVRDAALAALAQSAMTAAVALKLTPHTQHLEIDLLAVGGADRGHGIGSWTMKTLCALSDLYGVDLRLEVSSLAWSGVAASMSDDELEAWYGRYGFRREDDGDVRRMVRSATRAAAP